MSSPPPSLRTPTAPLDRSILRIAVVVVLGAIMSVLDTTIVNVALDTLGEELGGPLSSIQWIVTGYLLALAAVIPLAGWLSRRFGMRTLYIAALVVFTFGSLLCALAWSTETLILARVIQGVGGGLILPVGQMIIARAAGPERMGRVMGLIGVPIVLAPIIGPALGGVLLEAASWHWIFLINLPIGVATVFAALRLLPADRPTTAPGRFDATGLALVAPGLVAVTYGLAETATEPLLSAPVLVPIVVGLALVTTFAVRSLRIPAPLLDVRLFANPGFRNASLLTFALGGALFGAMILFPLYFQDVRGESAAAAGLLMAPQGVGAAVAMFISGRLTERYGGGPISIIGVSLCAAGTVPFAFLGADTSYIATSASMVVRGLGIGMAFVPAMAAAFVVLRPDQIGDASPQLNTLQRVGGSLGTALFTVVLQQRLDDAAPTAVAAADGYAHTFWWVVGMSLVALVPAFALRRAERRAARPAAAEVPAARSATTPVAEGSPA